jgi:hypothetical protein
MRSSRTIDVVLWVFQVFLGLFFALASGAPKFFLPVEMLGMPILLPKAFVVFIGTCEVLGGLGLILPGLLRIRPGVTSAAATGLVLLTICAAIYQMMGRQPESAVFALVMGLLCAVVGYGRWRVAPLRSGDRHLSRPPALQPAM